MEFLILGPLEVRDGEQTVRLGAAKQRALLGVLLLHANETVSTSRLVDELWGEQLPATAEKLVQGYVHALRKQLGAGVIETQAPGYRLIVEPRSLDLLEFERLTEEARTAPAAYSIELRRRALALAWAAARGRRSRGAGAAQPRPPQRAATDHANRAHRSRDPARAPSTGPRRTRGARRRAPVPGASGCAAHARAVPLRATGRGARGLPHGSNEAERRARPPARPGATRPGGGDPAARTTRSRHRLRRASPPSRVPSQPQPEPPTAPPPATPATARARRLARRARRHSGPHRRAPPPRRARAGRRAAELRRRDRRGHESSRALHSPSRPGRARSPREEFVWVGNLDDESLTRIDPATYEPVRIDLEATPDAVTVGVVRSGS